MGGHEHAGHGDCSEVLHRIYEYLDGEMSQDDVARVAHHLEECRPCLAEHDLDKAVKEVVRRACTEDPAPDYLRLRISRSITVLRSDTDG
jgi:mycothiol system anti-sigma-R factor